MGKIAYGESFSMIRHLQKTWNTDDTTKGDLEGALNATQFTPHMAIKKSRIWESPISNFQVNEKFINHIRRAITHAPRNKATETDEVCVEMLKVDTERTSAVIAHLLKICWSWDTC